MLSSQATAGESDSPYLGLSLVTPWIFVLAGLAIPLAAWFGLYDPSPWRTFETDWPNPTSEVLVVLLCAALFLIPLYWVLKKRVLDLLALELAQNALIFAGYFYLDLTAAHLEEANLAILKMTSLAVLFNAVGFFCFLSALITVYLVAQTRGYRLKPLSGPAGLMDWRLVWLVRLLSFFCAGAIALPMILTHTVPLLSSAGAEARLDLVMDSDVGRAVYHLGTALLPFLVGTLVMAIIAHPPRLFGLDPVMILLMTGLQLLTSNRLPLSITLMVTLCLVTMQYRLPRVVLLLIFLGYFFLFTFLSGFTSLLRTNPHALQQDDWFSGSVQEAFLGDNIIDLRDGSWVLSQWDFQPLLGKTYLGGAVALMPSGLFPEKKQWHLGLTGVRIVGLPEDAHFGLRITFFGEAFLNFGWAGVVLLGTCLGAAYGVVLRQIHLAAAEAASPCLCRNLVLLILLQCGLPLTNTSDAFIFWALLGLLAMIWFVVIRPTRTTHDRLSEKSPLQPA